MASKKSVKERMAGGETVFGTWCLIPSPLVVDVLANAGFDFVVIDLEHGPIGPKEAADMLLAAQGRIEMFVRVANYDYAAVQHALDFGASGVIVPHVESVQDRVAAVSASKYPPAGSRGFSPFVKSGGYTSRAVDTEASNKQLLTGIMIEGRAGLQNMDKILDDKNIDLVYAGTYDLSVALGMPGKVDSAPVLSALEDVIKKSRRSGHAVGCMANDVAGLQKLKKMGVQFILYKVDTAIILDSCKSVMNEVRNE